MRILTGTLFFSSPSTAPAYDLSHIDTRTNSTSVDPVPTHRDPDRVVIGQQVPSDQHGPRYQHRRVTRSRVQGLRGCGKTTKKSVAYYATLHLYQQSMARTTQTRACVCCWIFFLVLFMRLYLAQSFACVDSQTKPSLFVTTIFSFLNRRARSFSQGDIRAITTIFMWMILPGSTRRDSSQHQRPAPLLSGYAFIRFSDD